MSAPANGPPWEADTPTSSPETFRLGERLKNFRALFSFLLAFLLLGLALFRADIDLDAVWQRIRALDLTLYLLAFLFFYALLPVRAVRWRLVLRSAGVPVDSPEARQRFSSLRHLTEILWLSWFVNGVLPARIGDVYRGYLFQKQSGHPFSQALGTIFAERVVDLVVLFFVLVFSGLITFGARWNADLTLIFLGGFFLAVLLLVGLALFYRAGWLAKKILPTRFHGGYDRFVAGLFASFRAKNFPGVLLTTVIIWLGEGVRLSLVLLAMGGQDIGIFAAVFIALLGALLTSLPLLPGGLGLTELGITGALLWVGLPREEAFATATLDRLINYWSIVLLGFFLYLVSGKKR